MNVEKLIKELSKYDPKAVVLVYDDNEESSTKLFAIQKETKESRNYCKSDHVLDYEEFPTGTITLIGRA